MFVSSVSVHIPTHPRLDQSDEGREATPETVADRRVRLCSRSPEVAAECRSQDRTENSAVLATQLRVAM
jgi:hypothetical protein